MNKAEFLLDSMPENVFRVLKIKYFRLICWLTVSPTFRFLRYIVSRFKNYFEYAQSVRLSAIRIRGENALLSKKFYPKKPPELAIIETIAKRLTAWPLSVRGAGIKRFVNQTSTSVQDNLFHFQAMRIAPIFSGFHQECDGHAAYRFLAEFRSFPTDVLPIPVYAREDLL